MVLELLRLTPLYDAAHADDAGAGPSEPTLTATTPTPTDHPAGHQSKNRLDGWGALDGGERTQAETVGGKSVASKRYLREACSALMWYRSHSTTVAAVWLPCRFCILRQRRGVATSTARVDYCSLMTNAAVAQALLCRSW